MSNISDSRTYDAAVTKDELTTGSGPGLATNVPTFERGVSELGSGSLDSQLRSTALADSLGSHTASSPLATQQPATSASELGSIAFASKTSGTGSSEPFVALSDPSRLTENIGASSKDQPALSGLKGTSSDFSTPPASQGLSSSFQPGSQGAGSSFQPGSADPSNSADQPKLAQGSSLSQATLPSSSTTTSSLTGTSLTSDKSQTSLPGDKPAGVTTSGDHVTNLISGVAGIALTAPLAAAEVLTGHASNAASTLQQKANEQGLGGVASSVSETLSSISAQAQPYVSAASEKVSGAVSAARDPNAPSFSEQASNVTSSLSHSASSIANNATETVKGLAASAQETLTALGQKAGLVSPTTQTTHAQSAVTTDSATHPDNRGPDGNFAPTVIGDGTA